MNAGQFEQVGAPAEVYRRPATVFAARFLGLNNIVPVDSWRDQIAQTPLGAFPVDAPSGEAPALLLHPDGITPDADGQIGGTVVESVFLGGAYRVELRTDAGIPLTFKLAARDQHSPAPGEPLRVSIAPECVLPLKK
jgi:ABC-type Fe3+/spermidine/putrescine transport system ATPase subunit